MIPRLVVLFLGLLLWTSSAAGASVRVLWAEPGATGPVEDGLRRELGLFDLLLVGEEEVPSPGWTELVPPVGQKLWLVELRPGTPLPATATVLLRRETLAIVALAPGGEEGLCGATLRHESLRAPPPSAVVRLPRDRPLDLGADPSVKEAIVASLERARYEQDVRELSGDLPVEVRGESVVLHNRFTRQPLNAVAADLLEDRFAALGLDVERQVFVLNQDTTCNVVAERRGSLTPDEIVVVGAHYDSISDDPYVTAPGAEDNASGVGVVLRMAEAFASHDLDRTLHFVCFGAEEQALNGSYEYVSRAVAAGETIVAAVLLDMVSVWQTRYQIDIEGKTTFEELMSLYAANVETAAPLLDYEKKYFSFGSDHVPFQNAGIPAFLAIESDYESYPDYHKTTDVYTNLDPGLGIDVARATAGALCDLVAPQGGGTPVLLSGLRASATPEAVSLEWELAFAAPGDGVRIHRRVDGAPPTLRTPQPLMATDGPMRFTERWPEAPARTIEYLLGLLPEGDDEEVGLGSLQVTVPGIPLPLVRLEQNRPNPFNPSTIIPLTLREATTVRLSVHDVAGRLVTILHDGPLPAGTRHLRWDATDRLGRRVSSGTYFYRLRAEGRVESRRMVVVE